MMFVLLNSNKTGVTNGVGTAKSFRSTQVLPWFSLGVPAAQYLVFCVVFCISLSFCSFSFGHCIVCP